MIHLIIFILVAGIAHGAYEALAMDLGWLVVDADDNPITILHEAEDRRDAMHFANNVLPGGNYLIIKWDAPLNREYYTREA